MIPIFPDEDNEDELLLQKKKNHLDSSLSGPVPGTIADLDDQNVPPPSPPLSSMSISPEPLSSMSHSVLNGDGTKQIQATTITTTIAPPIPPPQPRRIGISEKFTIVFIKPLNQKSIVLRTNILLSNNLENNGGPCYVESSSSNGDSNGVLVPQPSKQLVTTVNVVDSKQSSSESLRSISSTQTTVSTNSVLNNGSGSNSVNGTVSTLVTSNGNRSRATTKAASKRRSKKSKRRHHLQFEKSIFQMLSRSLESIDCKLEKVIFKNDYIIKFNGNFTVADFSYENFVIFLNQLWQEVNSSEFFSPEALAIIQNDNDVNDSSGDQSSCWSSKIIIEFSLNFMMRMYRLLFSNDTMLYTPHLWSNYERIDIVNLHLGSLINLSNYLSHFSVADHCLPANSNNGKQQQQSRFSHQTMKLEIKYMKKSICIYFHLDSKHRLFKLLISFSSIKLILIEELINMRRLFLDLFYSPLLFYVDLDDYQLKKLDEDCVCDLNLIWKRTINLQNNNQNQRTNEFDPNLFGLAKSLCIEFPTAVSITPVTTTNGNNQQQLLMQQQLQQQQLFKKLLYISNTCKSLNKNFSFYLASVELNKSAINYGTVKNLLLSRRLPFSTYFACLTLFSTSYKIADELKENNLLNDFVDLIVRESNTDKLLVEQTLYLLKIQYKEHCLCNIYAEFVKLITEEKAYLDGKSMAHNDFVMIRKAVLTPSHLELFPPVPLLRSRFSNIASVEYSIRVSVLDDNNQPLNNLKRSFDLEFILNNIKPKLLDGLTIGDRCYEFLGSSSSQMRENGVIFYSKDDQERTAQSIRNMAGDLSSFNHDVAKYVARFGLMFSQAMGHFKVNDSQIKVVMAKDFLGDVKPNFLNYVNFKKEQHIFSDGVGVVSQDVAQKIIQSLDVKLSEVPSAFQIRYGGCKGMLVVYQASQPMIIFRNSMCKYNSLDNSLGILKFSAPRPVFLNRPLINILDQMQVQPGVFYSFFDQSTAMVAKASLYDNWALELIKTYSTSYLPYDHIYNCGISLLTEPFFRAIINYLIYYRLNELKCKARIRIPYTNGRIAFGVVDESQELEYGEIFFQYTIMSADGHPTGETAILEGEVMVTKFPCQQPGDVRKLRAVKHAKRLLHIKDCIVFPAKGQRPHPDEMGGSDLDGDEYAIFWETGLIFPCGNFEPMTFPYGIGKRQDDSITIDDIVDFYCNYLLYNNIGRVANCHLMFSDIHPNGLFSRQSHALAIQYSIALDFQKTGFYNMHSRQFHLTIRPDFMERFATSRIYLSRRILGQFFRHCCLIEKVIDLSQFDQFLAPSIVTETPNVNTKTLPDTNNKYMVKNQRFVLRDWKKFEAEAEEAFLEYKLRIIELLEQLDIDNEIILLCDVYEDKSDVSKVLIIGLFDYFRIKFDQQAARLKTPEDRLLLISAWYSIVFEKCSMYNGKQLLGLPWLISSEMCHLSNELDRSNVKSNLMMSVDGDMEPRISVTTNAAAAAPKPSTANSSSDSDSSNDDDEENLDECSSDGTATPNKNKGRTGTTPPSAMEYDFSKFFIKEINPNQLTINDLTEFDLKISGSFQFKIALHLIVEWIRLIRSKIYRTSAQQFCFLLDSSATSTFGKLVLTNGMTSNGGDQRSNNNREPVKVSLLNYSSVSLPEDVLFEKYFQKFFQTEIDKLRSTASLDLFRSRSSSTCQPITVILPSVSFLFNSCLAHLFELCNLSNQLILNGNLEKIFLLKYAVFGLSFMNKFDENLDRQFGKLCPNGSSDGDEQQQQCYVEHLHTLFETFPTNEDFTKENNRFFMLIQHNFPFDISKDERMTFEKLCYLSGVESIKFSKEKNDIIVDEGGGGSDIAETFDTGNAAENNRQQQQSQQSQQQQSQGQQSKQVAAGYANSETIDQAELASIQSITPYLVRTIGLAHSIAILRLLLGHPDFVGNIFEKFIIDLKLCPIIVPFGSSAANAHNHNQNGYHNNHHQNGYHHRDYHNNNNHNGHAHNHHYQQSQQQHGITSKNHHQQQRHHSTISNKTIHHFGGGVTGISNGGGGGAGGAGRRRQQNNRKNNNNSNNNFGNKERKKFGL